jgi:hypothetical protein
MAVTRTRSSTWLRSIPWIGIVAAIAIVQVVRQQPFDAVLFGVGAVALAVDATGAVPTRRRPSIALTVVIVVAAAVAIVLALAPRHGFVAALAMGAVGLVAVPLAWLAPTRGAAEDDPRRRIRIRRAAVGWAGVVVVMCLVELWSFLAGRMTVEAQGQHPAISELLDPALDDPVGRAVFVVAWLAIGMLLLTRGRRSRDA